jgi:hypothetical protein
MLRATGARGLRPLSMLASAQAAASRPAASLLLLHREQRRARSSSLSATHEQHALLRSDVKRLGRMLGGAISAHSGDTVFQKVGGEGC